MDQRQIEVFRAIFDTGSVTAAARALGVSQPAVSGSLAKLEKHLGFDLFRREGRRLFPTTEARRLHAEASRLLDGFQRFGRTAGEMAAGQLGTLTIATNPGPAICWLPPIVAAFRQERPGVQIRLLTRSSSEVRELGALSAFDLGLAEAPFAMGEQVIHRYSIPRVAVLPETHALAKHDVLTPKLLDGVELIATIRSSWSWASIVRAFDEAGAILRVVTECEFTAIALNLAAAGAGICFTDLISARMAGPGLVVRPFSPSIPYEVGLLSPAHSNMTVLAQAFSKALHDHIASYMVEDRSS